MPEFPEVATVVKTLKTLILNREIETIEILDEKFIKNYDVDKFIDILSGQKISDVRQYGKYIYIDFDKHTLISHLRMEGKYNYYDEFLEINKHDYVIFKFSDNSSLHYNDTRKFGTMHLVGIHDETSLPSISKLGPEPFSDELTANYLYEKIGNKKLSIKQFLLDQTVVVGFGNIYVDETLYQSKIHPKTSVSKISIIDLENIIIAGRNIFTQAIKSGGSSIKSYTISDGVKGSFQLMHNVYGKNGEECPRCLSVIQKIKLGGRGTHFCPVCQKEK